MKFEGITIEEKALFDGYLTRDDIMWEYNFATLLAWDVGGTMKFSADDGDLFIYNTFGGEVVFMPPLLRRRDGLLAAVEKIADYAAESGMTSWRIHGLDRGQAELLASHGYETTTDRNDYDYVYLTDDLKYLRGKAYHSKRNFVTRFVTEYEYEFREYRDEDRVGLTDLYDLWQSGAAHSTLAVEKQAILRAIDMRRELDLNVSVLKANGEYAAFSVCTVGPNGVAHCLFEKAETRYVGIYQAINKFTAEKYYPDGILVNRQEDMGIEGLRKAKLSYEPKMLLEKYSARKVR